MIFTSGLNKIRFYIHFSNISLVLHILFHIFYLINSCNLRKSVIYIFMEVYSIINDLDPNYIKEEVCLLGDALLRNKYLLRKYSTEFKNTSPTAFIRRLRFYVK